MPKPATRIKTLFVKIFLLFIFLLTACTTVTQKQPAISQSRIYNNFILVKATEKDTLSSLAAEYLNDSTKDWLIAEFNDNKTITSGQKSIIPLKHFYKGGIKSTGYQTVPVLLYQGFSKNKAGRMIVAEADFEAQMKYLKENGYHVIMLEQLLDFIDFKEQIPEKSVVITIDDGWRSFYDIAYPILIKYRFPATLFVYTDFIGGRKAMSWEQIKEISQKGFDIQCKTRTHRNLTRLKEKESFKEYFESIEKEISYPEKLVKQKLRKDCSCLAYPYGATNSLVIAILKKQGYRAAFIVKQGSNPFFVDNFRIKRSEIYGKYDIERFKKMLSVFQKMELK